MESETLDARQLDLPAVDKRPTAENPPRAALEPAQSCLATGARSSSTARPRSEFITLARALLRRTEKGRAYGAITAKAFAALEALLWGFHNAKSGLCFPSYEKIGLRSRSDDPVLARGVIALKIIDFECASRVIVPTCRHLRGRFPLAWRSLLGRALGTEAAYGKIVSQARASPCFALSMAGKLMRRGRASRVSDFKLRHCQRFALLDSPCEETVNNSDQLENLEAYADARRCAIPRHGHGMLVNNPTRDPAATELSAQKQTRRARSNHQDILPPPRSPPLSFAQEDHTHRRLRQECAKTARSFRAIRRLGIDVERPFGG